MTTLAADHPETVAHVLLDAEVGGTLEGLARLAGRTHTLDGEDSDFLPVVVVGDHVPVFPAEHQVIRGKDTGRGRVTVRRVIAHLDFEMTHDRSGESRKQGRVVFRPHDGKHGKAIGGGLRM